MAERLSVEQDVVGSKPISLPKAIHILLVKHHSEKRFLYDNRNHIFSKKETVYKLSLFLTFYTFGFYGGNKTQIFKFHEVFLTCGRNRTRTCDPILVRDVL